MTDKQLLPVDRFLDTLKVVSREGHHLAYSWHRLYEQSISREWVENLEAKPEIAERLEAFVSRFGRMQDTMADKLLPRWLTALAEVPGSQIEVLNRAERLGTVESVQKWLEAGKLRNRLVHEYMESPAAFARDLILAKDYARVLVDTYNRMLDFARDRMSISTEQLPVKQRLGAHPDEMGIDCGQEPGDQE